MRRLNIRYAPTISQREVYRIREDAVTEVGNNWPGDVFRRVCRIANVTERVMCSNNRASSTAKDERAFPLEPS